MIAPPCQTNEARGLIGCDGMIWSQKRTPVTRKVPCMSQMCTDWLFSARSKSAGKCQSTMAALKAPNAVHGFMTSPTDGPQRTGPGAQQKGSPEPAAKPHREGEQQGDPRGPGHDQDRGVEGDEDVLDHVDEEVVIGPVVDGRLHRHQEAGQPPVEQRASASGGILVRRGSERARNRANPTSWAATTATTTTRNGSNDQ